MKRFRKSAIALVLALLMALQGTEPIFVQAKEAIEDVQKNADFSRPEALTEEEAGITDSTSGEQDKSQQSDADVQNETTPSEDTETQEEQTTPAEETEENPQEKEVELKEPQDYYPIPEEPEGELIDYDAISKTYKTGDKQYTTVYGGYVGTYKNEDGDTELVDNTLVKPEEADTPASEEAQEASSVVATEEKEEKTEVYQNKANDYAILLPEQMSEENGVTIENGKTRIGIIPVDGDYTHSVIKDNAILYNEVYEGADVQYTVLDSSIKEDIVLQQPTDREVYEYELQIPGYQAEVKDNQVYIYPEGKTIKDAKYLLEAPSMEDAAGEISFLITLELREEDGKTILTVKPDRDWLSAEERQYPVRIDPTPVEIQKSSFEATAEANRTDVVYTSATLEALKTAITNAQAVAAKEDATKAEVQAQVTALQTALDSLRVVDKTNLNALIEKAKAEAAKTDVYESSSLTVLNTAITLAENVAANPKATEAEVAAAEKSLTTALNGLVEKAVVDKSKLESKIAEAKTYLSQTDIYTESSLATLQSAVGRAQNVMDNDSASQKLVDDQVTKLTEAIQQLAKKSDGKLDIKNLADGVYSIYGTMVKVDKNTYSMSNEAINHTIKLTVKNGKYYITLNFNGLTVGQKLGYLSQLKYFTTGYSVDPQYGNPQGSLADVTVDSYQKNADGTLVSDSYGTNYPDVVTFELIPEALNDGYVPLQVFVPIMDAISSGTGTQPVYLKLDWSSLKATTSDDPDFDKNDNNNSNSNGNNNSNSSIGNSSLGNNTLGSSSLGSSKLGSSSLGSGSSSLKSGTSSLGSGSSLKSASNVKTGDVVQNNTLWAAILLLGGVALLAGIMEYNRKKKANIK